MRLSKHSFVLILIASGLLLNAESLRGNGESPQPTKSSSPLPSKEEGKSHNEANNAQRLPDTPAKPPHIVSQPASEPNQYSANADSDESYWPTKGSLPDWLLVIVGGITAFYAWRTLGHIAIQSETAAKAATASLEEATAIKLAERAYVKISHFQPGVVFYPGMGPGVQVRVENFGHTPARVTDVVLAFKSLPRMSDIPPEPDYSGARDIPTRAFMIHGDSFTVPRNSPFSEAEGREFMSGAKQLLLLGFIDYIDQFGNRHRFGYGRKYDPIRDIRDPLISEEIYRQRNNLSLITLPGYNYDRPRKPGEGNDWNEPT